MSGRDYFEDAESTPSMWVPFLKTVGLSAVCVVVLVICALWFRATGGGS